MKKAGSWFIVLIVVLVAAAAAYSYYTTVYLPAQTPPEPSFQTARARTGDLVISIFGVGELVPQGQGSAAFSSSGVVAEVLAAAGDRVEAGQLLARLDDTNALLQLTQSQQTLQDLFSPAALLQAELAELSAEVAYEKAQGELQTLISPAVWQAEQNLANAQQALASASGAAAQAEARSAIELAEATLAQALLDYSTLYLPAIFTRPFTNPTTGESERGVFPPSAAEIALARTKLELASVTLEESRAYAAVLSQGIPCDANGELTYDAPLPNKVDQACQSIRSATLAIEKTRLLAPLSGTLTSFNLVAGQQVGVNPVATVATLDQLTVKVYVDEVDLASLRVGQRVLVAFNAFPDESVSGSVRVIEPTLQNIGGTLAAVAWVDLDEPDSMTLYAGMGAEVEIIAGEALGTVLVPVQAIRELAPGSYAVFVVGEDGALRLTPVSVGLSDFANAEILAGLKAGDIVSTGVVETR